MEDKFQKIKEIVEKELSCSAHNMDHVVRVYNLCIYLAKNEDVDLDVLQASALLHDIARVKEDNDPTGNTDHAILSAEMSIPILQDLGFLEEKIEHIKYCINSHRFRSGNEPKTIEAKILFDADKLDVLGAIGIARSFAIAGKYDERFYSDTPLNQYIKENLEEGDSRGRIKEVSKHTPYFEFETKFKHIPERLYTKKAKEIAKGRLEVMEKFFKRLQREVNGEL